MATTDSPLKLVHRFALPAAGSENKLGSIQLFPWTKSSAGKIFNRRWHGSDQWSQMVADFSETFLVGYGGRLYICASRDAFCFDVTDPDNPADGAPQVAWALRTHRPYDPLALLADSRRFFVFNVRQKRIIGYILQHGGRITSIAVHPNSPNIFATTSADFTTRVYDLDFEVQKNIENPVWPPWTGPSHASAAHGTDGSDAEGSGLGRCIQILVGGRSGGHNWDVSGAAFHPRLPLIATCGADRHVKIWRIPSNSNETTVREDKPLFSARVTTARVLSIAWLADDLLLMHTGMTFIPIDAEISSSPMPTGEYPEERTYYDRFQHGTVDVFKWYGLKRYFPDHEPNPNPVMRGGPSDYQESKSYTVMATERLVPPSQMPDQVIEPISNISQQQAPGLDGSFLFAFPDSMGFSIVHAAGLTRRAVVPSEESGVDDLLVMTKMTKRIRLDDSPTTLDEPSTSVSTPRLIVEQFPNLEVEPAKPVEIAACAMTPSRIVVLGTNGNIWILKKT
ncbi:hypothetical protein DFH07DRAFT_788908 [Mycena maculata]|uniref:WD40 repeat-like protein n=1 Tax=Mycena maculata TaxID=230809 RepID=A0AAD7KFT3_9AGAR|nr:hypothetical protein DFH07DRAFT_788908 [Mycena maculata]